LALPIPKALLQAQKKIADIAGIQNELDQHVYASMTLQSKCMFEVIVYPETPEFPDEGWGNISSKDGALQTGKNLLNSAGTVLSIAQDFLMYRYYLYAINDIPLIGFEYQRYGGWQGLKDAIYPETITMTFIEDSIGLCKRYLGTWQNDIGSYRSKERDFIFNDNQAKTKRTCIILPYQEIMIPSLFGWIMIQGLKLKQITGIGYDHSIGDHELITVEFSIDNIIFRDIANNAITDKLF